MQKIIPVILSGGSGTRLWPLSRASLPKQLLPLVTDDSMLQATLKRLSGWAGIAEPVVVCGNDHRFLVAEQLRDMQVKPPLNHVRAYWAQHRTSHCCGCVCA